MVCFTYKLKLNLTIKKLRGSFNNFFSVQGKLLLIILMKVSRYFVNSHISVSLLSGILHQVCSIKQSKGSRICMETETAFICFMPRAVSMNNHAKFYCILCCLSKHYMRICLNIKFKTSNKFKRFSFIKLLLNGYFCTVQYDPPYPILQQNQ